jgi:hypothetical protein
VEEEAVVEPVQDLDAPRLLRRMSLDLRGVLPSVEELDAVEADPTLVAHYRDEYLQDPRLEDNLVRMFAERWFTRLDVFELRYYDFDLDPTQEFEFEASVGEEPLRLMAHVAVEDRPWTEVVTADYTMANEMLAELWPLQYPEDESGWQESYYLDERPAAGVLTSNGLWWRYVTNVSNMNRGRAAAMARLLLCQDLLSRPVSLEGAVTLEESEGEEDSSEEAIRTVPGCVNCHATIDPLAATLFGYWTVIQYNPLEMSSYHAEREILGPEYLGVEMSYFGQPVSGLSEVGLAIANDPRFFTCTARTAAEALWRRPIEERDFARIEELRRTFLSEGVLYRELLRAVLDTPEYKAGALAEAATEEDEEREVTARLITPDLTSTAVEDLTGFLWTYEGFEQLRNDNPGYRVLTGGVDGYAVTRPQQDPGITWSLTMKRNAQAAASHAVDTELVAGEEGPLFNHVTLESVPGDAEFRAELESLHWRMYAIRPDEARLQELEALWSAVLVEHTPQEAWYVLISSMLRDPDFISY